MLFLIHKIQCLAVVTGCHQESARQNVNVVQLCVSERINRLPMLDVRNVDINFGLVHFTRELRQNLYANHTMLNGPLDTAHGEERK